MASLTSLFPFVLVPPAVLSLAALPPRGEEVELDDAEVFIEFNSTDGDFGIQFFWDGDPWDRMTVENPGEETVLKVKINNNLRRQGLTEGFFESAEPPTSVLSPGSPPCSCRRAQPSSGAISRSRGEHAEGWADR